MTPPARLYVRLSAARPLAALRGRRARRAAAIPAERAERLRRPAEAAPLLQGCCETCWLTAGRIHERTCRIVAEEVDG